MTVVARWEWRIFQADVDEVFAGLEPDRVEESDEVYLLAPHSDASVKIRGGRLDVKQLLEVDDDGLERWMPALKTGFPVSPADVQLACAALAVAPPPLERDEYTREDLAGIPGVLAVDVHKRRMRYTVDGCMAERTILRTDAGQSGSVAIESPEPERVMALVRELGFGSRRVVCVARGLKALVGFGAARFAVIDVGTNSVKLHVGERAADGSWRTIADRADVTRLGEGLDGSGRLAAGAMARTADAVAGMAVQARRDGVETIAAVGTAGLRMAANAREFIDAVRARCDVEIEVISGEDEARLAYVAATRSLGRLPASRVVFDTGGGSSQFTFGDGDRVLERFSVPVGAVRFTERHGLDGPVSEASLAEALASIAADLGRLGGRPVPDAIVGMGGAVTNLAAVSHGLARYDPDVVHGTVLDAAELDRQIELYRERTADERRTIAGLQPARAEVILAGACVVRTVMTLLERDSVTVSDRGLRHGVLLERFDAPLPRSGEARPAVV